MYSYSFNLRDTKSEKTNIMLYIRKNGRLLCKISTGLKVRPEDWDAVKKRMKRSSDYHRIENEILSQWEASALKNVNMVQMGGGDIHDIKNAILLDMGRDSDVKDRTLFMPYYLRWSTTTTTRRMANRGMLYSYNLFKEYLGKREPSFSDITNRLIEGYIEWMAARGLNPNTRGNHVKRIKTVMREAYDEGLHDNNDFKKFRKEQERVQNIYLTDDEIAAIEDLSLVGLKAKVRDIFIVACHTALRFSDCIRLRPEDVRDGVIYQKQLKTNEDVVIPCHPKVMEVLMRYDGMPKVSQQKVNSIIKDVCREAGIKDIIGIRRHAQREAQYCEKWELVTTHTARRSAATNMYKAGIPVMAIMKITGHTTQRIFMEYIKVSREENAEMLKDNPFFNS